ncbi:CIC11C00000004198 [Sungouiella intermedia]|uniref:CIC11C00000004198 n=1 Tax=Sungouiella intermedia TaxID=45354 RepID=A0A1L0FSG0_9ASCO|nr:CIC11C00000004198 [[Candida] intermedia]
MTTVAPIMMPPKTKRRSFKIKRSPRLASFSHPLDSPRDDSWDSDVESVLDSSYNESILSVTSLDSNGAYSVLPLSSCCATKRTVATPAVVLTPLVTTRCSELRATSSYSKLLGLMKRHDERKEKISTINEKSNLHSIDRMLRWRSFLLSVMTFAMIPFSPRSTDDTVPIDVEIKTTNTISINGVNSINYINNLGNYDDERELVTFATISPNPASLELKYSKVRNRDFRINCDFLKCYALDFCARQNRKLPITTSPEEVEQLMQDPALRWFNSRYGLRTISNISREKLWDSVILPPRSDLHPQGAIDYSKYSYVGGDEPLGSGPSVVSKHSKYIPWATHRTSLRPAGVLATSKPHTSKTPMGGVTATQYTIKGWCNERWTCN